MEYVIKANTPEETRTAIIELLKHLAKQERDQMRLTKHKGSQTLHIGRAQVLENAANVLLVNTRLEPKQE